MFKAADNTVNGTKRPKGHNGWFMSEPNYNMRRSAQKLLRRMKR